MLYADAVSFAYGQSPVLEDVSVEAGGRQRLGIIGPNGSGKTTLLHLLAGLLEPTTGEVRLADEPMRRLARTRVARRMAMVPQETHLAFDYSVLEIALMGRHPHLGAFELEGPDDLAIAHDALRATGTDHLAARRFTTLSGGEKQRVVIASAVTQLIPRPNAQAPPGDVMLLLDEPTASLDLGYQLEIAATLRSLSDHRDITLVVSTHDLNFAAAVCSELVLLRAGRVIANGPTDRVLTAANVRALYGVEVDVTRHPTTGRLTVVPVGRVVDDASREDRR